MAGCSDGRVRVLDVATGAFASHDATRYDDTVLSVACAASCELVASGTASGSLRLTRTGPNSQSDIHIPDLVRKKISNSYILDREVLRREGSAINSVAWAPQGARLACGLRNGQVQFFGATVDLEVSFEAGVLCMAWRPPLGEMLTVGLVNGSLQTVFAATGKVAHVFNTRVSPVYCVAWSPCGTWLAAGCKDGTLRLLRDEDPSETIL